MSRPERLRVALATDSLDPSGVGAHMLTLAQALGGAMDVIVGYRDCPAGHAFLARAARLAIGVKRLPRDDDMAAWLRAGDIDLLHVHAGIGWEGHALAQAAKTVAVPVVRTEHLPYLITDPRQRVDYRASLDLVDHVIAVSDAAAQTFKRAGAAHERLTTIRNGIATPRPNASRHDTRAALGLGEGDPVILTVARFTPQKGHASLLAAMDDVAAAFPSARLLLAGDGVGRPGMERVARELGLEGHVAFLGERQDVPDLLVAADLFVLPSMFEGLPLVVLEAMALGVPVVATRIGGTEEALGHAHPWYAAPNDPAALSGRIIEALSDAPARAQVGARGRTRFEAGYRASRMAAETAAVYRTATTSTVTRIGRSKRMQKTRIGFIGAGGIAQRHLGVLETFDDVRLAAFADTDFARAEEAASRFGAKAFASHGEMLESTDLDAVYICIPPFAHGEPERAVLARNLPFFVEKPLSLDIALAERVADEVARKNLVTAVGYHWRYLDTIDEARDRLVGNPVRLLSGYWLDSTPPPQWWWRTDRSGGQMVEQATHIIDLARYLAGDVVQVFGMAGHTERPDFGGLDVPTVSTASLRFASGAIGNIGATCLLNWSHRVGLHLFGEGLAIELTDHDIMVDVGAGRPVRRAEGDPVRREDRDFVDAVRGGENRIRCPYREALETHRAAIAIAQSAHSGMPISLGERAQEFARG